MASECGAPLHLSDLLGTEQQGQAPELSSLNLPGVALSSHAGYISVGPSPQVSHLFFWFFPAAKPSPFTKPELIVYLNGGPGNSSMIGLFEEIGPIKIMKDGSVRKRDVTWSDHFSLLFVDNPVGTGFSYTTGDDVTQLCDDVMTENLYSFLNQFFTLFPSTQKSDFYLAGMSYAGKYVTQLGHLVQQRRRKESGECGDDHKHQLKADLAGVIIGSGLCDPRKMLPRFPDLLTSTGIMTESQGDRAKQTIDRAIARHGRGEHREAVSELLKFIFSTVKECAGYQNLNNLLCTQAYDWQFVSYLNRPEVQSALHVRPCVFSFSRENTALDMAEDFLSGVGEKLMELLEACKVLLYSGQLDMVVSVPMTEAFLSTLTWAGRDDYLEGHNRSLWVDRGGELAGYATQAGNLTRVVVRKAGHRAAIDQPQWTLDMALNFVRNLPFQSSVEQRSGHPLVEKR